MSCLDNLSLEALICESRPRILHKAIQKIKGSEDRWLAFYLRSTETERLVVSMDPAAPGLFFAKADWPSGGPATDDVLALRKYLAGGTVVEVRKELADRVVFLDTDVHHLSGRTARLTVVLELIPKRTRALVVDERQVVLAAFPANRQNSQVLATPYKPPELRPGFRLDTIQESELMKLLSTESNISAWKRIAGLSPAFAAELAYRSRKTPSAAWSELQLLLSEIRQGPYSPGIYSEPRGSTSTVRPVERFISPVVLRSQRNKACETFPSMNDAVLAFFLRARQEADRVARLRSRLSSIAAALKRSERLKANLQADLERSQLAENYKVYAGLLYAQPDRSPKGITGLKVINLFDPELPEIEIPLDPQYSLVQNANRYSKLHQKANRSIPLIEKRIARLQTEMHALRTEKQEITSQSGSAGSVGVTGTSEQQVDREPHLARRSRSERISERPGKSGIRNAAAFNPQSQLRKVAKSFVSSEGLQILVGRTSKGNDILTQQIARSEDFWLHVAGYGGSHVVLRNPEKLSVAPRKSLVEAAQLAAYFSQARNAAKVEVHYTQKRFVSKPKGAKPGMVRLKEFKSISARPCLLDETAQW